MSIKRILFFIIIISPVSHAGVETHLFSDSTEECKIEVSHTAATGSSTGSLLFSSYKIIDGVQWVCETSSSSVTEALSSGLKELSKNENLVPISSIRIGHIEYYLWVKDFLEIYKNNFKGEQFTYNKFNELVASDPISSPFKLAIEKNGLKFIKADCEKIIFFKNGAPKDGFCWLNIDNT